MCKDWFCLTQLEHTQAAAATPGIVLPYMILYILNRVSKCWRRTKQNYTPTMTTSAYLAINVETMAGSKTSCLNLVSSFLGCQCYIPSINESTCTPYFSGQWNVTCQSSFHQIKTDPLNHGLARSAHINFSSGWWKALEEFWFETLIWTQNWFPINTHVTTRSLQDQ